MIHVDRVAGVKDMYENIIKGSNTVIGEDVSFGDNVRLGSNVVIEDHIRIGDNVCIDHNSLIRSRVTLGSGINIGAGCIIGEYQLSRPGDNTNQDAELFIGENTLIRSGSIIYNGSRIGSNVQTGHQVTIREKTEIGDYSSIGTLSDIQGHCRIGNYVRLHSSVHVGQSTVIDDCCWIYPYVVFTNDPTPPSATEIGVHVHSFAVVATGSIVLPGIEIASDTLVAASTLVNRNVDRYQVIAGNPGKVIRDIREIKDKTTGEPHYPWRYHFDRSMPWNNYGFDNWYDGLDEEIKIHMLG